MVSISSNFNAIANYQALLILFWFWIGFSIDSDKRKAKKQRQRISRNIEKQQKPIVTSVPVYGFR